MPSGRLAQTDAPWGASLWPIYPTEQQNANVRGMVYASAFHRIVVIGSMYTAEQFNFTLNVGYVSEADMPPVDNDCATKVTDAVKTWFPKLYAAQGPSISQDVKLTSVKVNRIGTNGLYMDADTFETLVTPPIAGGSGLDMPPQLAVAVTLGTVLPRGPGSKGRFYLPSTAGAVAISSDGRMSTSTAAQIAAAGKELVKSINAAYVAWTGGGAGTKLVCVVSNSGAGSIHAVTEIRVGRVVDTIRSRRSSLDEDYQVLAMVP